MNPFTIFKKNLATLKTIDPTLAKLVSTVSNPDYIEFAKTQDNEPNLLINKTTPLHDPKGALKQANNWFSSLKLDVNNTNYTLYVFGMGLGYYFLPCKKWLKESDQRYLVFMETDLGVIHSFLFSPLAEHILHHGRVYIHYLHLVKNTSSVNSLQIDKKKIENLTLYFSPTDPYISALESYETKWPNLYKELQESISSTATCSNEWVTEFASFNKQYLINLLSNLSHVASFYMGTELYGRFSNIPAIICGAGPSLKKNHSLLKFLREKALIIAGSSAQNALTQKNIEPHFGVYLDPFERVYDRAIGNIGFEVPLFINGRPYNELIRILHASICYVKASIHPFASWLEAAIGILGPSFPPGISVSCLATEIAIHLGCNPIIYVGLDLAYTNKQLYASDVTNNNYIDKKKDTPFLAGSIVQTNDSSGNPIETKPAWLHESEWIATKAKQHPKITFINATEGGLGFSGMDNIPLKNVSEQFLKHSYPIAEWIHSEIIAKKMQPSTQKKLYEKLREVKKSLLSCKALATKIIRAIKDIYKQHDIDFSSRCRDVIGQYESILHKEIAYQLLLKQAEIAAGYIIAKKERELLCLSLSAPQEYLNQIRYKILIDKYDFFLKGIESFVQAFDRQLVKKT